MGIEYKIITEITKEVLDSIKVGDLIKVNNWKKPLKVRAVSENYFVMASRIFDKWDYSVCEKKSWDGVRYNSMVGDMFHVGTDGWLFGSPVWNSFGCDGYDFDNFEASQEYINTFELSKDNREHAFISPRSAVSINKICIKLQNIKLSECTKPGQILLYDGETVSLQYILRQIFNGKKLPEIRLCSNQEQLDNAIANSLSALYNDVQNGVDKESYSLGKLDTILVEIDIDKKCIKQVDENGYNFEIVS